MEDPEIICKNIGLKLKELRIKKGYKSHENFAFDNELSRMQYWRMEKGIANCTIKSLLKVLSIHNISLKDFICQCFD